MNDAKYIGLDVHQATISATVLDSAGKLVMESILETKAATILQFMHGLRGDLQVTSKKAPVRHGYTICLSLMFGKCWCAIREKMLCSRSEIKVIASMPASWPSCCARICCARCITKTTASVR